MSNEKFTIDVKQEELFAVDHTKLTEAFMQTVLRAKLVRLIFKRKIQAYEASLKD